MTVSLQFLTEGLLPKKTATSVSELPIRPLKSKSSLPRQPSVPPTVYSSTNKELATQRFPLRHRQNNLLLVSIKVMLTSLRSVMVLILELTDSLLILRGKSVLARPVLRRAWTFGPTVVDAIWFSVPMGHRMLTFTSKTAPSMNGTSFGVSQTTRSVSLKPA